MTERALGHYRNCNRPHNCVLSLPLLSKRCIECVVEVIYVLVMMKGSVVADEMFPEGAGPYMDIDEASLIEF